MATPLTKRPALKPLLSLLKREGWAPLLFGSFFIRGMHGIPAVSHALFSVSKADIGSYELVYSRHDLWLVRSGLYSIISALLFMLVLLRWVRLLRRKA